MTDVNVQGNQITIPGSKTGYLVGSLSDTDQPAQLISVDDIASKVLARKGRLYQIGFSWPGGKPRASQRIGDHVFSIGVTFPPDFTEYMSHASQASGSANTTGSTAFKVQQNGSDVGTITFGAGGVTATFSSSGAAVAYSKGDKLTILAPASADATFANPCFTLVGYES